jgi:ATP-dependent DNA helicase PIF1
LRELASNPTNKELSNTILLQGEGGTGKTHALNCVIEKSHALGLPIGVCASSGIAATHLKGGRTAHSLFGIPVKDTNADTPVNDVQFSRIKADSYKGRLLKKYRIFIIDEVGMLNVDNIYTINMLLKDLHDTSVRFGRVLMIFTGDERQIMPIVRGVDPLSDRQADASFFFSQDCRLSTRIVLTENMRVHEGHANFIEWHRKIGSDGYQHVKFPHDTCNRLTRYICVPRQFARHNEDAFIREVFNAEVFAADPMMLARRVILAPHNATVNMINDRVASLMPPDRPTHTYLSTNVPDAYDVYDPTTVIFAADNLQSISSSDMPDHSLTLIVGMPVMCMYNLDVPNGICNGTVMIVERLESVVAWCRINTRYGQRLVPIVPMKFVYSSNGFKFTRTQMPLRRAFCVTNNRSQGGTYDVVGYHALRPIWAHGMLYTAATRPTSAGGFSILCPPQLTYYHSGRGEMFATTRNVVHPRVSGLTETITAEPLPQQPGEQHVIDEQDMDYGPEFESYNQDG